MSNWFKKWRADNKTCYMICFTDNKSKTSVEAFNTYNTLVPTNLQVKVENYSWQYLENGRIKSWVYTCDNVFRKELINWLNTTPNMHFLSQGTTKSKYKQYFHFGLD